MPSQADSAIFAALSGAPPAVYPHALRWFNHITSYGSNKEKFPGQKKDASAYGGAATTNGSAVDDDDDDDDDVDLFGSEDEEVTSTVALVTLWQNTGICSCMGYALFGGFHNYLAFAEGEPSPEMQRFFLFLGGQDGDWLDLFT